MLAQLAQFSALEQMLNVATNTEKQTALGLVGQFVEYSYVDEYGYTQWDIGKVDYVQTYGGNILLGIGDREVTMDDIYQVISPDNLTTGSSAFETIGQTVQAVIEVENEDGTYTTTIIEGEVLEVRMKDDTIYVVLGTGDKELEIEFTDVQNVVTNPTVTGKQVEGTVVDEDGETITVSGIAEYVYMQEDITYLYVNGYYVNFDDITSVKDPS